MDVTGLADDLERQLAAAGDPARAEKEAAYLKSELRHHGTGVPAIRKAVQTLVRAQPDLARDDVLGLAVALWDPPVHERRMATVEFLGLRGDVLTPDDLPLLERFVRESRTWALIDGLAANVIGGLRERFPAELEPALERWSQDEDHWVRRSSLLAYLVELRRGDGELKPFARKADRLLADPEFFVRKAIGWVLRDTSRRRPEMVVGWLEPRADRAARLTVREAVKHLPVPDRDRILGRAGIETATRGSSGAG